MAPLTTIMLHVASIYIAHYILIVILFHNYMYILYKYTKYVTFINID